jgi:hypothetical protein
LTARFGTLRSSVTFYKGFSVRSTVQRLALSGRQPSSDCGMIFRNRQSWPLSTYRRSPHPRLSRPRSLLRMSESVFLPMLIVLLKLGVDIQALFNDIRTLYALTTSTHDRLADITVPLLSPLTWSASISQHLNVDVQLHGYSPCLLADVTPKRRSSRLSTLRQYLVHTLNLPHFRSGMRSHTHSFDHPNYDPSRRLADPELATTLYSLCTRLNETNRNPIASLAGLLPLLGDLALDSNKMGPQIEIPDFTNLKTDTTSIRNPPPPSVRQGSVHLLRVWTLTILFSRGKEGLWIQIRSLSWSMILSIVQITIIRIHGSTSFGGLSLRHKKHISGLGSTPVPIQGAALPT